MNEQGEPVRHCIMYKFWVLPDSLTWTRHRIVYNCWVLPDSLTWTPSDTRFFSSTDGIWSMKQRSFLWVQVCWLSGVWDWGYLFVITKAGMTHYLTQASFLGTDSDRIAQCNLLCSEIPQLPPLAHHCGMTVPADERNQNHTNNTMWLSPLGNGKDHNTMSKKQGNCEKQSWT